VSVAAVVGDPAVGARQGDVDRGRDVDRSEEGRGGREWAAGQFVGGRADGAAVEVVGDRAAGVAGRARERRRVAQVVAGGAELHVSAGVGAYGRGARGHAHLVIDAVAAVRGAALVGVAAVVGDPAVGARQGDVDRGRDVD